MLVHVKLRPHVILHRAQVSLPVLDLQFLLNSLQFLLNSLPHDQLVDYVVQPCTSENISEIILEITLPPYRS